ncbi:unnamed protein product [Cochlearia groenlandica]
MGVILLMLLKLFLRYDPLESGQLNLTRAGGYFGSSTSMKGMAGAPCSAYSSSALIVEILAIIDSHNATIPYLDAPWVTVIVVLGGDVNETRALAFVQPSAESGLFSGCRRRAYLLFSYGKSLALSFQ